jgi:hypothetical protein
MAKRPKIGDYKRVLVVEGYSDLLFYVEALERIGMQDQVFIQDCNGRADLDLKLHDLLSPGFLSEKTHVGVIVDADQDAEGAAGRFSSVLKTLTKQDASAGCWSSSVPHIGLWIAPGDGNTGEIETLVWKAWSSDPANALSKSCIDSFVACMGRNGLQAKSPDKGMISSLLAIKNDEDPRLGPGARARVFDFSRPEFASLLEFLKGFTS